MKHELPELPPEKTGDEDVPNTPEQNLPPLEYSGEPTLSEEPPNKVQRSLGENAHAMTTLKPGICEIGA